MTIKINFFNPYLLLIWLFPVKLINLNFVILDVLYRAQHSDSIFNFYSFFWTNFWYLPIFFIFIFFCYINTISQYLTSYLWIFVIFGIFYAIEISNFFISNYQFEILNRNFNNFNFFLLNNINKYHPFIFYLSVIFLTANNYFYTFSKCCDFFFYKKEFFLITIFWAIKITFYVNFSALFLGSWWAIQEGSWGGWWNWDASETLGLFVFLPTLIFFHYSFNVVNWVNFSYNFKVVTLSLIMSYYFIQLNFDFVSHNFGIKFFFFFNNTLFLLESAIMAFFLIFKICMNYFTYFTALMLIKKIQALCYKTTTYKYFAILVFFFYSSVGIAASFNLLINYFFWTFAALNLFNCDFVISKTLTFIFLIVLNYLIKLKLNHFYYFFSSFVDYFINLILFFSIRQNILFFSVHFFLLNLLLINIFSKDLIISFDDTGVAAKSIYNGTLFYFTTIKNSIDTIFIETIIELFSIKNTSSGWSLNGILMPFNHAFFIFTSTFINTSTFYFLNTDRVFLFTAIELMFTDYLVILILFLLIIIYNIFYRAIIFFK